MSDEKDLRKYTKNVKAFIQILPNINVCWEDVKILDDNKTIYVRRIQDFGKGKQSKTSNFWTFATDGILYKLDQNEVYKSVVEQSLEKALQGVDVIVTAYGQTGSGKSTTINGLQYAYENRGIAPRIITELFHLKEKLKLRSKVKFSVSFVEVEKYFIIDLLKSEEKNRCFTLKDIKTVKIKSQYEGLRQLFHGESRRRIYFESSYISHAATSVFTIYVKNCSILNTDAVDTYSKIHIIDMAGIDNCGNMSCSWKNCKEVGTANLTKSQLEMFLLLLQDFSKNKNIVKDFGTLVQYLGDALSPQSIIRFIGHIRCNRNDLLFTLSTLRFAHTARCIKAAKLTRLVVKSEHLTLQNLQKELHYLVKQNYLNSMLMNEDLSTNITQSRAEQMHNTIEEYLRDKINEISVLNVANATAVLSTFKEMCNKLETDKINVLRQIQRSSIKTGSRNTVASASERNSQKQGSVSGVSQILTKRKSSAKASTKKSILDVKSTHVGSVTKSGTSIGRIKSSNYQGIVTKAQKKHRKLSSTSDEQSSKMLRSSKQNKSRLSQQTSEINLEIKIDEDNEAAWKSYRSNENLRYNELNHKLRKLEKSSRDILKEYNDVINKLESVTSCMDSKKNDLFKMQMYKTNYNLKCESEETINLNRLQENTELQIVELYGQRENLKEQLCTLQAELKINIEYYRKIKTDMKEEFNKFCLENFKIQLPSTEEIMQCIEDKLLLPDAEAKPSIKDNEKDMFEKLQANLKKIQRKNF